ncbi:MAG: hypothetical protein J2P46_21225 [Zavarzinella sp.]|nr:hypothetical protein [Zavarzinella sp.]
MNFVLFLILNAVLLLRPEEVFPGITGGLRLYLIVIIACVVTSLPGIIARLTPDALRERPIGVCVLGLWAAGFLSHFVYRWRPEEGMDFAGEFGKVVLYYFLLVSVVTSAGRFRVFVGWLVLCIVASSTLALLDYHGYVEIPAIQPALQGEIDPQTGESFILERLTSSGIYSDPNDLCLALVFGMLACTYLAISGAGIFRLAWLLPIIPIGYAFVLTYSKGGMLGLLAGVSAWLFARYGGKRSVPLAAVVAIGLVAVVGGRQGELDGGGTAHQRVMVAGEGIRDLVTNSRCLINGLGVDYYFENFGVVAHNSFISAYIETGLLGGGFFLGAFYVAGRLVYAYGGGLPPVDWARVARPFLFAAVVAYAAGAYSISRQFVLPTYVTLGLASAYFELTLPELPVGHRVSAAWFRWLAVLSVLGLVVLKFVTQGLGMLGV